MKRYKRSKTLWFNALMTGLVTLEASLHVLQPMVEANVYGMMALLLAVGNAVLRVITSEGLTK